MGLIREFTVDALRVRVHSDRETMGLEASREAVSRLAALLSTKAEVNAVFAAAPSQNEFLRGLVMNGGIEWNRINAFHMDEYVGLSPDAPQGFGNFLRERLFRHVPFKSVNPMDCSVRDLPDAEAECMRYGALLEAYPPDIVFMGIGENGHIAFNDPPVAKFDDERTVKVVELDQRCREQQVNDGCFQSLSDVPTHAITLTVPALASATGIVCVVPAPSKAEAVRSTLRGPVSTACPASILRTHPSAVLYLDADSASLLDG